MFHTLGRPSILGKISGLGWLIVIAVSCVLGAAQWAWAEDASEAQWELVLGFDKEVFPSLIVSTATLKSLDDEERDPTEMGDSNGVIGVRVVSPRNGAKVKVEMTCPELFATTTADFVLPKKGETYTLFPVLKYDLNKLLGYRQAFPGTVAAKLFVDGKEIGEKTERITVRSINDCMMGFRDGDEFVDTAFLFAAYVNESHPWIDKFLGEVLDGGEVESFAGYQKSADEVMEEMEAIYNGLKDRGFRYSNITRCSMDSDEIFAQHVRLLGDSVKTAQANCVDGSVLMASIFRKLEMDCFLMLVPGHMLIGVWTDPEHEEFICIETTMIGTDSFEDAVKAGENQFLEHEEILTNDDPSDGAGIVDIGAWRKMGIMPLKEIAANAVE